MAELVQKLGLEEYMAILKLCWLTERRRTAFLPREIPEEVCDEFHVALFAKCQGRFNQIAYNSRDAARLNCLNSDDYAPLDSRTCVEDSAAAWVGAAPRHGRTTRSRRFAGSPEQRRLRCSVQRLPTIALRDHGLVPVRDEGEDAREDREPDHLALGSSLRPRNPSPPPTP